MNGTMSAQKTTRQTAIKVASLDDLFKHEAAIVRRINDTPNGGRLFLADPLRLLKDINVDLTPATQRALETKLGVNTLANNPLKHLYEDFQRDAARSDQSVKITINGIIPQEATK